MSSSNNAGSSKKRVYELARELELEDTKSLINLLKGLGYDNVKTATSSISEEAERRVRETIGPHLEQLRRTAQAKQEKEKAEAAPSAKPAVRVVKRATQEEKQALLDRKPQTNSEPAPRPVRTANVKVRQTSGAFKRGATFNGIPMLRRANDPVLNRSRAKAAEEAAKIEAEKKAQEAEEQAKAEAARLEAERIAQEAAEKAQEEAAQAAKIEAEKKAQEEAERARQNNQGNQRNNGDKFRRQRSGKRMPIDDFDDEENEKELVDMPIISAEEMGIQQDEDISLSADDAFSTDFSSQVSAYINSRSKSNRQMEKITPVRSKVKGHNASQQQNSQHNSQNGRNQGGRNQNQNNNRNNQQNNRNQNNRNNQKGQRNNNAQNNNRNQGNRANQGRNTQTPTVASAVPQEKTIVIPEVISLADLASRMGRPAANLIMDLARQGRMVTINQPMYYDEAKSLALSYGYKVSDMAAEDIPLELIDDVDTDNQKPRPPVISVLGHVDHGKTSLLDAIRRTSVTAGEAGGITQKIGAYTVNYDGRPITFIDTPGHEAFTHMRARGASITDIAILVVAANDGVMPQTIEAINHAKAARLPIIVAINKIDLPESNAERVMQQLTEYGLVATEWGGDTEMCKVSAKRNINLDELLELLLLQADILELKANPDRKAKGTIIEGSIDKGKGPVATVLVQDGTLHAGDIVVVGNTWGKLRKLTNEKGKDIKSAGPSIPVEIIGLESVPNAGDSLQVVEDEKMARQVSEARTAQARHARINSGSKQTLENLFADLDNNSTKQLNLLVKAEAHGSMQALVQALNKLSTDEVAVKIFHSGVGAISESDVMLASASNAIIIGFNVRPDAKVRRLADMEEVEIRTYRVIFDVTEQIKKAMSGMLTPDVEEVNLGRAEVRQVFKISKIGKVAGCFVTEGKVVRGASARLIRDSSVIYESSIETLRRFKDDAREVNEGFECGLTITNYQDLQEGDVIECFQKVEHQREL